MADPELPDRLQALALIVRDTLRVLKEIDAETQKRLDALEGRVAALSENVSQRFNA